MNSWKSERMKIIFLKSFILDVWLRFEYASGTVNSYRKKLHLKSLIGPGPILEIKGSIRWVLKRTLFLHATIWHHGWPAKRKFCIKDTFRWLETASRNLNMSFFINTLWLQQQYFGVWKTQNNNFKPLV